MIDILLLLGLAVGIYTIFSPIEVRKYATTTTTTDPNVIKAVMARDVAAAQQSSAEARAMMQAEGYVPREVAEGEIDQYAAWRAIPDDPQHSMDYLLGNRNKAPTPWGWCRKVIYDEGEAHCSYDRGEMSPEEHAQWFKDLFKSMGFKSGTPLAENDPRNAIVEEYQRRTQQNRLQRLFLDDCYTCATSTMRTAGTSISICPNRSGIVKRKNKCPPVQLGMTLTQYIAANYRPISTADLDPIIKEIAIQEAGGIENLEYNRRLGEKLSEEQSQYVSEKLRQNQIAREECQKAYFSKYGEESTVASGCEKLITEGLKFYDLPWVKNVPYPKLNSAYTKARIGAFGAYGGRLTKRRDYLM